MKWSSKLYKRLTIALCNCVLPSWYISSCSRWAFIYSFSCNPRDFICWNSPAVSVFVTVVSPAVKEDTGRSFSFFFFPSNFLFIIKLSVCRWCSLSWCSLCFVATCLRPCSLIGFTSFQTDKPRLTQAMRSPVLPPDNTLVLSVSHNHLRPAVLLSYWGTLTVLPL